MNSSRPLRGFRPEQVTRFALRSSNCWIAAGLARAVVIFLPDFQGEKFMRIVKPLSCSATATIALALLLQGCASTTSEDGARQQAAAMKCNAGEIMNCGTSSSGRISDGRYGRNRGNRRTNCTCQSEQDLDSLIRSELPSEPH